MDSIEKIITETTDANQSQVDWTGAWSERYPVLKRYQQEVNIPEYAAAIRSMFQRLQDEHGYSEQDAMLVLKDILYHEYKDKKPSSKERR